MTVQHDPRDTRSFSDLISDLVTQMTSLFRTETTLLKAEMRENLTKLGAGAGEIGAGVMIIQAALVILLIALVQAIESLGIGFGWASLIVGVVMALVGAFLLKKGKDNLSATAMMPDRTVNQVQKDARLAREETR
jgi:hypothetical protein